MASCKLVFLLLIACMASNVASKAANFTTRMDATFECTTSIETVTIQPGETVNLIAPTSRFRTRDFCGFRVETDSSYALQVDCTQVDPPRNLEMRIQSDHAVDGFGSPFSFLAPASGIYLYLSRSNRRLNIRDAFTCTATTAPLATQNDQSCSCGVVPSARIIGGQDASEFEYPWMVSLASSGHFCGGSLLTPTKVLTAAHCVNFNDIGSSTATVGQYDFGQDESYTQTRVIQNVQRHFDYSDFGFTNDIAIVTVDAFDMTLPGVATICLPQNLDNNYLDDTVRVIGWGYTVDGGPNTAQVLQEVDIEVVSNAECSQDFNGNIPGSIVCAETDGGGKNSCNGDSGGPLMYIDNNVFEEVGLVSFGGRVCASPDYPTAYTRITSFIDFIEYNVGGKQNLCART